MNGLGKLVEQPLCSQGPVWVILVDSGISAARPVWGAGNAGSLLVVSTMLLADYMKAPESNDQAFLVSEHDDDREFHVSIR
jgi:hypothetical protein